MTTVPTVPAPALESTVNGSTVIMTHQLESIPNGVGFSDDVDDEDLIDEDALLDDIDDLAISIQQRKQIP